MENQDLTVSFQNVDKAQTDFLIKFLEDAHQFPTVQEGFEMQLKLLDIKPGNHVLDVGCGIGDQALTMAKQAGINGKVVGTDLSHTMVEVSKSRHSNSGLPLDFVVASATQQPFADGSFDRIRTERVLMYIKNVEDVFSEYKRLLKPGGKLLVFDMDWDAMVFAHPDKKLTRRIVEFISDSFPYGRIGADLFRYFKESGFKDIQVKSIGYASTTLEFTKRVCEGITQTGVSNGSFTQDEVTNWWAALENDNSEGKYFASFQGFIVVGTK